MEGYDSINLDPKELLARAPLKRRSFLKGLGGGILVLVSMGRSRIGDAQQRNWQPFPGKL